MFYANFMKKIVLLLFVLCLTATTSLLAGDDQQFIPITVLDNTVKSGGRTHRAPAFIPIRAYYDSISSSVCVQFSYDIGNVNITIENLSTDDNNDCCIDSSLGSVYLPIIGGDGDYHIEFILSSGAGFEGYFTVWYSSLQKNCIDW